MCGTFFAASAGAFMCYGVILKMDSTPLLGEDLTRIEYPFILSITVFVLAFYIPQNFCIMYDTIMESMVFCLMADEEMFMGKERFCEPEILAYFN